MVAVGKVPKENPVAMVMRKDHGNL
ncbi:uncharacterized protein G2W53_004809 [Senna tora]|uniref:Uncharacterized protein n=1 Tax=Senna tora TaxID=362788 RepID=A0A834XEF0_9FABA|nr:uncharacterized protein G2W53_004809 [Senna tora]